MRRAEAVDAAARALLDYGDDREAERAGFPDWDVRFDALRAALALPEEESGPPRVCTGSGTLARDFTLVSSGAKRCGICGRDIGTYDGQHIIVHPWTVEPEEGTP